MRRRLIFTALCLAALVATATAGAKSSRPQAGSWLGTIRIPSIGVNLRLQEDTGALEPGNYPVHYGQTGLPCGGHAVAIAAHHATHGQPFGRLAQLKAGAIITIQMASPVCRGTFRYKVTGQQTYSCGSSWSEAMACPAAAVGFRRMAQDKLILTTCDDNGYVRRFVYAFAVR